MTVRNWSQTPIPTLSQTFKEQQRESYAQCADGCGFVYTDDVAPFVANLPCPACGVAYLHRRLGIQQLKPQSDYPQTFGKA